MADPGHRQVEEGGVVVFGWAWMSVSLPLEVTLPKMLHFAAGAASAALQLRA